MPADAEPTDPESRKQLRRTIIFVGAARNLLEDGRIGGQMFACRSLMTSRLASTYYLSPIDTSVNSISMNRGLLRAPSALSRLAQFVWKAAVHRPLAALVFAGHGLSFVEKGVMVILGKAMGVRMLLMPRSGHLIAQVDRSKPFAAFVRFVVKRASLTICQSASWQQFYAQLAGGHGRFKVVENWLPDGSFIAPHEAVSSSGGPEFVVGYFNRIEAAKGIFDFIEAVRLAAQCVPNLRAVIYGDGSLVDEMRNRIGDRELQSVIAYRGWLGDADKQRQLRQLDACIFTSHAEGFPNALLEIMAMKIPVVSVRVGAVPDMIEDGVTGLLTDIKDVDGLAARVVLLAEKPALRIRLAEAAYMRARSRNTLDQAVRSIEEALA